MIKRFMWACALVLLTAAASEARGRGTIPLHVRMVAYVGEKPQDARPEFSWVVNHKGKRYQLHVLKLLVLDGRSSPISINAAVTPYDVAFQVAGEKTAIQRFVTTPPRQQVVITGYLRLQSAARYLMLDTVEVSVATPAPTN